VRGEAGLDYYIFPAASREHGRATAEKLSTLPRPNWGSSGPRQGILHRDNASLPGASIFFAFFIV
jgi:hypothetical protein